MSAKLDSKILVVPNYRPGATFPWLVRGQEEHPEQAMVFKDLVLLGVDLHVVDSYGEGLTGGPMAICDDAIPFDPQFGLPEMKVKVPDVRSETFDGSGVSPWAVISIDVKMVSAAAHPDFKEVELEYVDGAFIPKGGGEPITTCAALTLFEDRTAKALIHVPQRRSLDQVLNALFGGWTSRWS